MRPLTFSMPFLPPSLNLYRNEHWRRQREEEKTWTDFITVKWADLGRPKLEAVRITMVFSFPDGKTRDLDNYLATGSKLVGDAIKGRFIPDDSPEHLTAWSFRFEFGNEAKTTVVIEEAGRGGAGDQATLWEDPPSQSKKKAAGDDVGRSSGERVLTGRLSGRQAAELPTVTGCPFRRNSCRHCPADVSPAGRTAEGAASENSPACALYETCLAPLCPLDRISLNGVWYPDEEICRSRSHGNFSWIKAQRKIARAATTGYFTLEILNSIRTIRKGITGLDPNVDEKPQLLRWLDLHERKRSDFGGRQNMPLVFEPGKPEPDGPSARRPAGPKKGVSAPLQNVAKQGGQGKNLCRNGGSQHPNRIGTGKPPSRRFAPQKNKTKG